ncbi:FHA domain-containing protein [Anaerolineae bacterium CFX9]|nr:FHA domain-containing protein [Anaerolineae bacterium CFX9]
MAFGRLDVFFPDGMYETFLLTEPNTSIGRSPGNTIALDTETISRYHLTITQTDGKVFLTDLDSQNGTFVDGTRLRQDEPFLLRGGEEINIGELILIFHDPDANPTRPILIPEEVTQHVGAVSADFSVDLEAPEIAISPGAYAPAKVTITNTSEKAERFIVRVSGVPAEWVRIDRPSLEVGAGKSASIAISFKPLRRSDSVP